MTNINVNDIASLVRDEVIKLKKLITPRQASKLSLQNRITENVYDQLTGDSCSQTAIYLLNKSAKPYSADLNQLKLPDHSNFDRKYNKNLFSPLEIFCHHATDTQLKFVHKYLQNKSDDNYISRFFNSIKPIKRQQHGK